MLNMVYPIYNPIPSVMKRHVDTWKSYSDDTRKNMNVVIVDDCSKTPVDVEIDFPMNLTIARITDDIYWNAPGAKNLGFSLCSGWVFSSDIDHLFTSEADITTCMNMDKDMGTVYYFNRLKENGTSRGKNHPNTFLVHTDKFREAGGYDEDFSKNRGFSDIIVAIFDRDYKKITLPVNVTEFKEFTCEDPRGRNFSHNGQLHIRKMGEIAKRTYKNGPTIRFKWQITREYKYGLK